MKLSLTINVETVRLRVLRLIGTQYALDLRTANYNFSTFYLYLCLNVIMFVFYAVQIQYAIVVCTLDIKLIFWS